MEKKTYTVMATIGDQTFKSTKNSFAEIVEICKVVLNFGGYITEIVCDD